MQTSNHGFAALGFLRRKNQINEYMKVDPNDLASLVKKIEFMRMGTKDIEPV